MAKFLREKKVVILLNGRHAGKEAVIVKNMQRSSLCWQDWRAHQHAPL